MKKSIIAALAAAIVIPFGASAQPKAADPGLEFTVVKENPITSIKNQNRSGTCWCFAAMALLESEAIRINNLKEEDYPDFSEMFVVSHSYQERAEEYVRMDGHIVFGAGSWSEDAVHHIMKNYGLVPQEVMSGLNYGTDLPVHGEVDAVAKAYVEAINKKPNRTLSTAWKNGFKGIMDAYFGECPTEFEYKGKKYTPASYRDSFHLNADDYVSLTSFTHHPFYTTFAVEVCDNWRRDVSYNVPIDELMDALYYALENGYTACWGGDVSETGFTRNGTALLLDPKASTSGSDQERWVGRPEDKPAEAKKAEAPKELVADQAFRQTGYDEKTTTDDHGMQAFGIAKDQYGNKYLMIKNSWGESGKYKGIWYMSDAFSRGKLLGIMLHKDALPKALKAKLGIK
mgnify:CR=1 FL=1